MIASLEVVQQISDKQQGFVNIHTRRSLSLSTYLPAFIAICVRLMYSSLESITAIFSPFTAMSQGPAPASRSLSLNYLTKAGPHAWFVSLAKRHYALTAILTANFLAAFLTIVVSGLYSESTVPFTSSVSLQQIDKFNLSMSSIGFEDNMAGAITNLITYTNASFPSWTYDSLVFPTLDMDNKTYVPQGNDSIAATIRVKTRATRASLNCTSEFKPNAIWANLDEREAENLRAAGMARLNLNTSLPWSLCDHPPSPLPPAPNWRQFYDVSNDTTTLLFGTTTVLQWDEERNAVSGNGLIPTGGGYYTPYPITTGGEAMLDPMSGRGCPSFSMVLGTASVGPSASNKSEWSVHAADVGMLVCWQNFHEVETNLTLRYPGLDIPVDEPPTPDEESAKVLWNGTSGPSFEFNINNLFITLRRTKTAVEEAHNATIDEYHLDKFMRALADGGDGVPLEQLAGASNTDALLAASQRLYGRYMAQAISNNMRASVGAEDDAASGGSNSTVLSAGLSRTGAGARIRLRQNAGPKIALQVMLGLMIAGAVAMRLLLRVRDVLLHDPCSIAGTAALVVDGNIMSLFNEGDNKLDHQLYMMGWSMNDDGERRFGIRRVSGPGTDGQSLVLMESQIS
jgi:hypothetical protein